MVGRVCSVCVMDESNPNIKFDSVGQCDCCRDARQRMPHVWFPGADGRAQLEEFVAALRLRGRGSPYDAMIGLSGGVDSSYLAYVLRREFGLRLLAVHVDGGWNSEAAVSNIELLVRRLEIDLHTYVVEWSEMRDLQLAFLRASVLNQDIPQDHAFFATLYRTAVSYRISNFLSGINFSSESVSPRNWGYPAIDGRHVKAIHTQFGQQPLTSFPIMPAREYLWLTRFRRQLTISHPLNVLPYDKTQAKQILISELGYKDYGSKHSESRFTKFYQELYLPQRYGFDKRRLHLSSQIVSGQVSRAAALLELESPICEPVQAARDLRYIAKKLAITPTELGRIMRLPTIEHTVYPNNLRLFKLGNRLNQVISVRRNFR